MLILFLVMNVLYMMRDDGLNLKKKVIQWKNIIMKNDGLTKKQSKLESLIESFVNTFSGWFISFLLWSFAIGPLFNIETSILENMGITAIFTVVSIGRSYFWRRFFNAGIHRNLVILVKKIYKNDK